MLLGRLHMPDLGRLPWRRVMPIRQRVRDVQQQRRLLPHECAGVVRRELLLPLQLAVQQETRRASLHAGHVFHAYCGLGAEQGCGLL